MIAEGLRHGDAGGRHICQVALLDRRQFDPVQRMHVVVFPRHVPRHVRLVEAQHEEERLAVRAAQFGDAVVGDLRVGHGGVAALDDAEPDAADAAVDGPGRSVIASPFPPAGGGPLLGKAEAAVPQFPHAEGGISGLLELHHEGLIGGDGAGEGMAVVVDAGGRRPTAAQQGRAGRIADGCRAVRVGEADAHRRKAIQMRRLRLPVAAQMADPVIEIVHGDEEDIGCCLLRGDGRRRRGQAAEERQGENQTQHHGGGDRRCDVRVTARPSADSGSRRR